MQALAAPMPENGNLAFLLLEQSPACTWAVSLQGFFQEFYGDPSAIFGQSGKDLAGRAVTEALAPDQARTWIDRFSRALHGETLSLRQPSRDAVWNVSVFPVRVHGEILYAGALAREISDWTTAERELRHTVLGALKSQEFERKMASKFLHDTVGQNLTALGLQLDLVRMDLETPAPEACRRIEEVQKVLGTIMEDVREYSYRLNPSTVERAGLRTALDRLLIRVRGQFTGSVRLNVDPSLKLDPAVAPALFHIAQEALENALRHAGCSAIEIAVKSTRNGPSLEVRDNGRGFDPADLAAGRRGLGLLSMEHYAAQAGLTLSIVSGRSSGTTVHAAQTGQE
jgi:two-component system NarL family sensor kinase